MEGGGGTPESPAPRKQVKVRDHLLNKGLISIADPLDYFSNLTSIFRGAGVDGLGSRVFRGTVKSPQAGISTVALKQVWLGLTEQDEEHESAVEREIICLKHFSHPNLLKFFGAYMTSDCDDEVFIATEYCSGGSLADAMRLKHQPLSEDVIRVVLIGVLSALDHLHTAGYVHRDIRSENILLTDAYEPVVADMGSIARLDNCSGAIGTGHWMAPEVCQGMSYNEKADIWSVGITAIELAEIETPISREGGSSDARLMCAPKLAHPSQWSPEFSEFLSACLTLDPSVRSTAKELLRHPFLTFAHPADNQLLLEPIVKAWQKRVEDESSLERQRALLCDTDDDESLCSSRILDHDLRWKALKGSPSKATLPNRSKHSPRHSSPSRRSFSPSRSSPTTLRSSSPHRTHPTFSPTSTSSHSPGRRRPGRSPARKRGTSPSPASPSHSPVSSPPCRPQSSPHEVRKLDIRGMDAPKEAFCGVKESGSGGSRSTMEQSLGPYSAHIDPLDSTSGDVSPKLTGDDEYQQLLAEQRELKEELAKLQLQSEADPKDEYLELLREQGEILRRHCMGTAPITAEDLFAMYSAECSKLTERSETIKEALQRVKVSIGDLAQCYASIKDKITTDVSEPNTPSSRAQNSNRFKRNSTSQLLGQPQPARLRSVKIRESKLYQDPYRRSSGP